MDPVATSPPHGPFLGGFRGLERKRLPAEIIAGLTLAAVAIPECMGYTRIAGTPIVTGLYTILLPVVAFAILGSSRHLVVGADSASAAIIFAGLSALGIASVKPGSEQWLTLAATIAIATGLLLLMARIVGLGFLSDFLSRTVLVGFLSGVGVTVAVKMIPGVLAVPIPSGGFFLTLYRTAREIPHASLVSLAMALVVIAIAVVPEIFWKRFPGALVAVIFSIAATSIWDLQSHGLTVVGAVPKGLPHLSIPHPGWHLTSQLAGISVSVFLVVLAQGVATSRSFALRHGYEVDENADLVGLGAANIAAGLTGTFPVNGSPTKTAVADDAGARSQMALLVMAAVVLLMLVFATGLLADLPDAALNAIVLLIGVRLIDIQGLLRIHRFRHTEFYVAVATAFVVMVFGVRDGIITAIVLSILDNVRHSYHPRDFVLVHEDGQWKPEKPARGLETEPGLIVYRFGAELFYANAERFASEVVDLVATAPHQVRVLLLDAAAITYMDYTGWQTTLDVYRRLKNSGVRVIVTHVDEHVRHEMKRYRLLDELGTDNVYDTMSAALKAAGYRRP
jgi:high affinity sulfate transporter 1